MVTVLAQIKDHENNEGGLAVDGDPHSNSRLRAGVSMLRCDVIKVMFSLVSAKGLNEHASQSKPCLVAYITPG